MIFAFSLIPIVMLVGGGLDYRRMSTSRAYVQDAADAAVLSAAKDYFKNASLAAGPRLASAKTAAQNAFNASLVNQTGTVLNFTWDLTLDSTTNTLKVDGTAYSPTLFAALVGISQWHYGVHAYAAAGGKPVEIALILDNTSSMFEVGTGGSAVRFTTMRSAAESYVNQVFDLGGDRVKVAVVPWATLVNINSEPVAAVDPTAASVPTVAPQGSGRAPITAAVSRLGVLAEPAAPTTALTAARLAALSAPTTWRGCVRSATGEVTVDANGNVTKPITDAAPSGKWPVALMSSTMAVTLTAGKAAVPAVPATTKTVTTTICDATAPGTKTTTTTVCDSYTTVTTPDPPGAQGALDHRRRKFGDAVIERADDRHVVGFSARPRGMTAQQAEWARLWRRTGTTTVCTASHTVTTTTATTVCTKSHTTTATVNVAAVPAKAAVPASCTKQELYSADLAQYNAFLQDASPCASVTPTVSACQSDPNDIPYVNVGSAKCSWRPDAFSGSARNWNAETQAISGPNVNCPVPILPLSGNRAQVLNKLNEMYPVPSGTLTDVGILWGLRTLSPNSYWTTFWGLNATQAPGAFNNNSVYKIAILLSDGNNEAPFWMEGYYGCTAGATSSTPTGDRHYQGDCWRSPNIAALPRTLTADNAAANNMMLSACNQMRSVYGVDLYYILVDVTDATALANAQQCAPDPGHAISTTSGNLQSVFNNLVSHSLRLTH